MAKINDLKCKDCGSDEFCLINKGIHTGVYCEKCGAWIKWANKKEVNLFTMQLFKGGKRNENK